MVLVLTTGYEYYKLSLKDSMFTFSTQSQRAYLFRQRAGPGGCGPSAWKVSQKSSGFAWHASKNTRRHGVCQQVLQQTSMAVVVRGCEPSACFSRFPWTQWQWHGCAIRSQRAMQFIRSQRTNPAMKSQDLWAAENRPRSERMRCKVVSKIKKYD